MSYCKYNHDVIGSSNLRDINDFLYYAVKNGIMTAKEANQFIVDVNNKDSKLPSVNFETFVSDTIL